jgi:hypothetical protein
MWLESRRDREQGRTGGSGQISDFVSGKKTIHPGCGEAGRQKTSSWFATWDFVYKSIVNERKKQKGFG